jgi:DNA-binding response OmpR family regulator
MAEEADYVKHRVLVVDDNLDILATVKRALELSGFKVLPVSNPEESVSVYEQRWREIALVLLGFEMPGLRGDEVLERLKRIRPDVRALMMTSSDVDGTVVEKGFRGLIRKPFTRDELLRRVNNAISSPRQKAALAEAQCSHMAPAIPLRTTGWR